AIHLAKAALRAGIDLLFQHAGVSEVHDIRLAGAFGSHIDPVYALVLGLVPDCPVQYVRSVGNAAGAGAVRALLSVAARREMETAVRNVVKVETATEPDFQSLFVAAMAFPHAVAQSPHLSEVLTLPAAISSAVNAERGGRRRRRDQLTTPEEP
ncbi:MAG: ASKHA domain-containing protein, partial [Actinomycetota bacterium]|nr:ASKHA domain-containing protein [Actinomycetota bacterium]